MTKIINITPTPKEYSDTGLFKESAETFTINNTGTQRVTLSDIESDSVLFTAGTFQANVEPSMPINSTLFFVDVNEVVQNTDGSFATTDQGFGSFATTDSSGIPTIGFGLPSISITSPLSGNFELETNQTLNWTSANVTNVNITITGDSGGSKVYSNVDASLGTYTFQLNATDGFIVNEEFSTKIEATIGATSDEVTGLDTIATLTMTTPVLTSGVAGNITGSANCTTVNVYERLSTDVSWDTFKLGVTVIAGAYTASGTVADSGLHDFLVIDADNASAYTQLDDVNVISSVTYYSMSAGITHSLGVIDGVAYSWGSDIYGQLGRATLENNLPLAVDVSGVLSGKTIVSVSAGYVISFALDSDGKVYSWGENYFGQLGDNSTIYRRVVPVAVNVAGVLSGKTIVSISTFWSHCLALDSDGKVYAWGRNDNGQLGDDSTTHRNVPVAVNVAGVLSGKTITKIATGQHHSLALDSDGKVYAWGRGRNGQLGDDTATQRNVPVEVDVSGVLSGKTIIEIAGGIYHSLALDSDGKVYSWGLNDKGQLGDDSTTQRNAPVAVNVAGVLSGKTIEAITALENSSLVIDSDGVAYSWGYNAYGQLGDNSITTRHLPVAVNVAGVLSDKVLTKINGGGDHTLAVDEDDVFYSWGYNYFGQLGNDTQTNEEVPILVDVSEV